MPFAYSMEDRKRKNSEISPEKEIQDQEQFINKKQKTSDDIIQASREILPTSEEQESSEICYWDLLPAEIKEHILTFVIPEDAIALFINKESYEIGKPLLEPLKRQAKKVIASCENRGEQYRSIKKALIEGKYLIARIICFNETFPEITPVDDLRIIAKSNENYSIELMRRILGVLRKSKIKPHINELFKISLASDDTETTVNKLEILLDFCTEYEEKLDLLKILIDENNQDIIKALKKHSSYSEIINLLLKKETYKIPQSISEIRIKQSKKNLLINHKDLIMRASKEGKYQELHSAIGSLLYDITRFKENTKKTVINLMLNQQDEIGLTPLHYTATIGSLHCAHILLHSGANPNLIDNQGRSPLIWAIIRNNIGMVKLLISYGPSINLKDNVGATPLTYSVMCGHQPISEFLLQNGATL